MLSLHVNDAFAPTTYHSLMETPGSRLRQLRTMRDMTLEQVAHVVGISAQAISQIETGATKNAKLEHFLKLCAFYDVDPYKLALGKQKSELVTELRLRRSTRNP